MNIFIAFANQDRDVRDKLLRQMDPVKDSQGWNIWSSKEILAGEDWDAEIKQRLMDSQVVILLLSADFLTSKYILEKELPQAVEKHKLGDCQIIPVIARVCHWKDTPFGKYAQLGDIQALPVGEKPIMSKRHWDNDDEPYFETVQGIKDSIQAFQAKKRGQIAVQQAHEAQARSGRERQETEQRIHLEQEKSLSTEAHQAQEAQRAKTVEAQRVKETEAERSQKLRRADAWRQATDTNTIGAYQIFFSQYPQGELALEALSRIKELKAASLPWGRYLAIGGGVLAVAVVLWMLFGRSPKSDGLTSSQPITTPVPKDTTKPAPIEQPKQDPTIPEKSKESEKPKFADPFEGQMVRVAGGTLTMGSPATESGRYDNECQHQVPVAAFSIGKYEVTQAQWKAVMDSNPSEHQGCDDCPVEQVSCNDVQMFIKKLNSLTGKRYRLPTEAEWEYAARGGKKSKGFTYSGSNTLGSVAWFRDNSDSKTHPVMRKAFNELSLYDMSGNVWEWCQNEYGPYLGCQQPSQAYADTHIMRGGTWNDTARACRSAMRSSNGSDYKGNNIGFRLAKS